MRTGFEVATVTRWEKNSELVLPIESGKNDFCPMCNKRGEDHGIFDDQVLCPDSWIIKDTYETETA